MIQYNKELSEHTPNYPVTSENVIDITKSILNMQGPHDRYLELCFDGDILIGFLYRKVDHEGHRGFIKLNYGCIMGFYVKQVHRRKGYGKAIFEHLKGLFAFHGTRKMYLTADPITGELFWNAMGFNTKGEKSPENGNLIYEKDVKNSRDIITIIISDYLNEELIHKIAVMQWHNTEPKFINSLKHMLYDGKRFSDCFNVIALNVQNEVIGRLYCLQNQRNPKLWYYGDLVVAPPYRSMKIASKMISTAINRLSDMGGETLCCYVDPRNTASLKLQASLGFNLTQYQVFDNLINDGDLYFVKSIGSSYSVSPLTVDEAIFVCMLYNSNIDALHGKEISFNEWKEILSKEDKDEQHFLIHQGAIPYAWLKINGLLNEDIAWISMLVVDKKKHNQGIGTYTIKFAEEFIRSKGFNLIGIHTTDDNIPAQNLYKKLGYTITEHGDCTTGDGIKRLGYTFIKNLIFDSNS